MAISISSLAVATTHWTCLICYITGGGWVGGRGFSPPLPFPSKIEPQGKCEGEGEEEEVETEMEVKEEKVNKENVKQEKVKEEKVKKKKVKEVMEKQYESETEKGDGCTASKQDRSG